MAQRQFNYTFVQLFNEELSQRLGCNFTMQALTSTRFVLALVTVFMLHHLRHLTSLAAQQLQRLPCRQVFSEVNASQLQFMYANPALHVCLEVSA